MNIKLSKEAIKALSFIWIFLAMWDLLVITSPLAGQEVTGIPETIGLNFLTLYCLTETGYSQLKSIVKFGLKSIFWLVVIVIIGFLVVRFFSLPPTTIIIFLLLYLIAQGRN